MKTNTARLMQNLELLKLHHIHDHGEEAARKAASAQVSHLDFLADLVQAEADAFQERALARRLQQARFPWIKALDQFKWSHPTRIDRQQVQHLFHLTFVEQKANVVFVGPTGMGKTHLAIALAHEACVRGHRVLFSTAIDIINHLNAAQQGHVLAREMKRYTAPEALVIDEIGYLPVDRQGADLLFQVFSHRYERGSIILTTNRVFKQWPRIFNNDAVLATALLDRLVHHCEVIVIEGKSYRLNGEIVPPSAQTQP